METKAVIFDIEGTVCPISFVKDILFPYAAKKIHSLINELPRETFPLSSTSNSTPKTLIEYLNDFPSQYTLTSQTLLDHIDHLITNDVKASYLKSLQGYLWKSGYESGEIKAPVYPDAINYIQKWSKSLPNDGGVYIYSSGSVAAQVLLFKYIENGIDLTPFLKGYYDTVNAGQKTVAESYKSIASQIHLSPKEILFFTDNPKEIDAAQEAGWQTILVVRPGNAPFDDSYKSKTPIVTSFDQVELK